MTRYEKILLLLLVFFLVWNLTGFAGGHAFFFLGLWVLAISYLLAGYALFDRAQIAPAIRIIAGVAFAAAVVSFNYMSRVEVTTLLKLLPVINIIFCIGLGAYMLLHRGEAAGLALRGLWLRSVVLLCISSFFAYCPIDFWPYRKALIGLNRGQEEVLSNLRMFDYGAEYSDAIDREDFAAAVAHGQQALLMGKRWLNADSVQLRWKISGAYTNLYTAYRRLGDTKFNQRQYQQALRAYQAGNAALLTNDNHRDGVETPNTYWEEEKAWALNNMALCYLKLERFEEADSLFIGAIKAYQRVYPIPDLSSARLMGNVAKSLFAQRQFDASTKILRAVSDVLAKDTTHKAAAMRVDNTLSISLNYLSQDSLPQALQLLQAMSYPPGDTATRCRVALQQGLCLYKMERFEAVPKALQSPLAYYRRHAAYWEVEALIEVLLAKNSLAQAAYPETQRHIANAQKLLLANKQGESNSLATSCLNVLGVLNKSIGKYPIADQQLTQAVVRAQNNADNSSSTLLEGLVQLADLDVLLGREQAAQEHVRAALALLAEGKVELPGQTGLLVIDAYVDYTQGHYPKASRKYRQVVAINTRYGQGYNGATAAAWNGLGLLATEQHRYDQADSVFQQAVRLHEKLFSTRHPLTANVYLNYGLLHLKQGRNADARLLFEKANTIAKALLPADHDMFGDLAMALGALAAQEKQAAIAHSYYKQAVAIYTGKFPATHWKVKAALRKAGA